MRAFVFTLVAEVVLFGIGRLTVPNWIDDNIIVWLPLAFGLLCVMLLQDHWPDWMHIRRDLFWADMDSAGRVHRDLLVKYRMTDSLKAFDAMVSPATPSESGVASAYSFIAVEGINDGQLEVWGVPENGSQEERLRNVDIDVGAWRTWREGGALELKSNGVFYRNLRVKRSTIRSYLDHMREHDAKLKDRERKGPA